MLASPLAAMQRTNHFLDAAGDVAAGIRKLNADVQRVQESLEKAGAGLDPASLLAPGNFSPTVGEAYSLPLRLMQVAWLPPPAKPYTAASSTAPRHDSPPSQVPPGVYYKWGHNACRHGLLLVALDRDKFDPHSLNCVAQIAPGADDATKSHWCVRPEACSPMVGQGRTSPFRKRRAPATTRAPQQPDI